MNFNDMDKMEALLDEYNNWSLMKRATADDITPSTFLVERAKEQALKRLIEASEFLDSLTDQEDFRVKRLKRILNGEE